jgi:hypothetical protein
MIPLPALSSRSANLILDSARSVVIRNQYGAPSSMRKPRKPAPQSMKCFLQEELRCCDVNSASIKSWSSLQHVPSLKQAPNNTDELRDIWRGWEMISDTKGSCYCHLPVETVRERRKCYGRVREIILLCFQHA